MDMTIRTIELVVKASWLKVTVLFVWLQSLSVSFSIEIPFNSLYHPWQLWCSGVLFRCHIYSHNWPLFYSRLVKWKILVLRNLLNVTVTRRIMWSMAAIESRSITRALFLASCGRPIAPQLMCWGLICVYPISYLWSCAEPAKKKSLPRQGALPLIS